MHKHGVRRVAQGIGEFIGNDEVFRFETNSPYARDNTIINERLNAHSHATTKKKYE